MYKIYTYIIEIIAMNTKVLNNYIIISKLKNSDNNQAELANSKSAMMREEGGGWGK